MNKEQGYDFTQAWFEKNISSWKKILPSFVSKNAHVLEIGGFEGAATTWILDHLLLGPHAKITCVDSFEGGVEHRSDPNIMKDLDSLEERFRNNIRRTGKENLVEILKKPSFDGLLKLTQENRKFDFIYIDGSHLAGDVLSDAILSWNLLKREGVLIFDDYHWNQYEEAYNNPQIAIDAFLACYKPEIELLDRAYQVMIRKKKREDVFTLKEKYRRERIDETA